MVCTTAPGPTACPAGSTCVGGSFCARSSCAGVPDGTACTDANGDSLCCGGVCVNPYGDPNNCGACGTKCGSGTCAGGIVFENGGFGGVQVCLPEPVDGGVSCLLAGGCPTGEVCIGKYCVAPLCNASAPQTAYCAAPDGNVGVCVNMTGTPPFPCTDHPM
jgi:hypothetical protein